MHNPKENRFWWLPPQKYFRSENLCNLQRTLGPADWGGNTTQNYFKVKTHKTFGAARFRISYTDEQFKAHMCVPNFGVPSLIEIHTLIQTLWGQNSTLDTENFVPQTL